MFPFLLVKCIYFYAEACSKNFVKCNTSPTKKGHLAFHNANGYLMMFLASCGVGFLILVCFETTIFVMYVSTYSLCLIYFYVMKVRHTGRNKLIKHLYYMVYYLNCFTTSRYLQNCLKNVTSKYIKYALNKC